MEVFKIEKSLAYKRKCLRYLHADLNVGKRVIFLPDLCFLISKIVSNAHCMVAIAFKERMYMSVFSEG